MILMSLFLPGEIHISQATGVTQYVAYGNENCGAIGNLVVTNYRVSFVTIIVNNSMVRDTRFLIIYSVLYKTYRNKFSVHVTQIYKK